MDILPTQKEGHLIVAALRIIEHREGRPGGPDEVATLLALQREEVAHWCRGLERHGVLGRIENPFDVRYELRDHTRLETLPAAHDASVLREEVDAFRERAEERNADLDELFGVGMADRKKKDMNKLEKELKRFQKSGRGRSPFDRPSDPSDEDE